MNVAGLAARARDLERMETETVSPDDFAVCLRDMERLIALARGYRPTLAWLARIAAGRDRLSVLDLGSGGGEMLRRIAAWAKARGISAELTGIDRDPQAVGAARAATDPDLPIRYQTGDILDLPEGPRADIVLGAHVAHHLTDPELVRFLRWMDGAARLGWYVNDLHRHPLAYWTMRAAMPVSGLHRFVRSDAPLSVARGFVRADWDRAIAAAGLDPERIEVAWHWPFRWGVGTRPGMGH